MSIITNRIISSFFRPLLTLAAALIMSISLHAADEALGSGWTEKYDEAVAESKKTGLPILADFTGSDWCSWCIKLHQEVFDTQEFKDWAAKNVVLLELDFPQRKAQDAALKAKNKELSEKYVVQAFPTILILDAEGKKLGKVGYKPGGGPKIWIEEFTKQYKAGGGK
jgi:thioredoxin-related protein